MIFVIVTNIGADIESAPIYGIYMQFVRNML